MTQKGLVTNLQSSYDNSPFFAYLRRFFVQTFNSLLDRNLSKDTSPTSALRTTYVELKIVLTSIIPTAPLIQIYNRLQTKMSIGVSTLSQVFVIYQQSCEAS